MNKKQITIIIISLIIGISIGSGFGAAFMSHIAFKGKNSANMMQLMIFEHHADWATRASQAYMSESPEVAIWAHKNFIDIKEQYLDILNSVEDNNRDSFFLAAEIKITKTSLFTSYARLALLYKEIDDQNNYRKSINKSLEIAKSRYKEIKTEEDLISYIKKWDRTNDKGKDITYIWPSLVKEKTTPIDRNSDIFLPSSCSGFLTSDLLLLT